MVNKQKLIKTIPYLMIKFAGAGFLLAVNAMYLFVSSKLDLYDFVEDMSHPFFWIIIFGYGITCSLLIDFAMFKFPRAGYKLKLLLYIVAGFGFFIISWNMYLILFAGIIGALCALIFYGGTWISSRIPAFRYIFSIVMPLGILFLMNVDFTEKEQWVEDKNDTSYTATFTYFNGKHEIPIEAKAGQIVHLSYKFTSTNGGGHGFHVLNEHNRLVGMTRVSDNEVNWEVEDTGVYRAVVTGDDVSGKFKVNWSMGEKE